MFFGKKEKKKCKFCGNKVEDSFSFCPHCGHPFPRNEKEEKDYGLLGRNDSIDTNIHDLPSQGFGITDRIFNSLFNSLMKSLDKQLQNQIKEMEKEIQNSEIKTIPNGIRIKIAPLNIKQKPKKKVPSKRQITEEQIKKITSLPKVQAKTNVKRLGDKIVYELSTPGVKSIDDILISKLESGYEVKALGNKKVYVNSIPINLVINRYSILKNKLLIEFDPAEQDSS